MIGFQSITTVSNCYLKKIKHLLSH